mmetsp:Transcript_151882/g.386091  ORF Transcript_151882/g.386091 Transcript_151882/m.386091 type:complete len:366 (+) Transcript_151882:180-1277(+)
MPAVLSPAATSGVLGPAAHPQALASATAGSTEPHLTFSLVVHKTPGCPLGIDVTYSSAATWTRNGVFVARVFEDGIVAEWNAKSEEPRRVRPGDFLFQVNHVHGDPLAVIQEMKVKQTLTIHILRRTASPLVPSAPLPQAHGNNEDDGGGGCGGGSDTAAAMAEAAAELGTAGAALSAVAASGTAGPPGIMAAATEAAAAAPPPEPPAPGADDNAPPPAAAAQPAGEVAQAVELDGTAVLELQPTAAAATGPPTVESLLPQLIALEDEALAGLICVALERRAWLKEEVLAGLDSDDEHEPPAEPEALEAATPPVAPTAAAIDGSSGGGDQSAAASAAGEEAPPLVAALLLQNGVGGGEDSPPSDS